MAPKLGRRTILQKTTLSFHFKKAFGGEGLHVAQSVWSITRETWWRADLPKGQAELSRLCARRVLSQNVPGLLQTLPEEGF